ncbi:hypothetical protein V5T82_00865 [Magnetovibrio sp. PR-2]|uniref:hypothetical protein n=1 Tax=Magnetovibrio sp. PR-2 TaxID=3120356 RepID=UPI002FCE14AD
MLPRPLPDFAPVEIDCITSVMLKILDGKCKMGAAEKDVMSALYHAVLGQSGEVLDPALHDVIAKAQEDLDEDMRLAIYEKRVLAETMISRPIMKAFKARLRDEGILPKHT